MRDNEKQCVKYLLNKYPEIKELINKGDFNTLFCTSNFRLSTRELKKFDLDNAMQPRPLPLLASSLLLAGVPIFSKMDYIPEDLFKFTEDITQLDIPSNILEIGDRAFFYCKNLTSVSLHEGLTAIGLNTFEYTKITDIILPRSVNSIEYYGLGIPSRVYTQFKDEVELKKQFGYETMDSVGR